MAENEMNEAEAKRVLWEVFEEACKKNETELQAAYLDMVVYGRCCWEWKIENGEIKLVFANADKGNGGGTNG